MASGPGETRPRGPGRLGGQRPFPTSAHRNGGKGGEPWGAQLGCPGEPAEGRVQAGAVTPPGRKGQDREELWMLQRGLGMAGSSRSWLKAPG